MARSARAGDPELATYLMLTRTGAELCTQSCWTLWCAPRDGAYVAALFPVRCPKVGCRPRDWGEPPRRSDPGAWLLWELGSCSGLVTWPPLPCGECQLTARGCLAQCGGCDLCSPPSRTELRHLPEPVQRLPPPPLPAGVAPACWQPGPPAWPPQRTPHSAAFPVHAHELRGEVFGHITYVVLFFLNAAS